MSFFTVTGDGEQDHKILFTLQKRTVQLQGIQQSNKVIKGDNHHHI